jgi:hypothetical protein
MSVAQPQPPRASTANREITIVSHSTLFYWWPVWAVGFLLGLLSMVGNWRMVTVPPPPGTEVIRGAEVIGPTKDGKVTSYKDREVIVLAAQEGKHTEGWLSENPLRLHIAHGKNYGVLFATVLLLVIVITNVPLRGMWSVMVIFLIITLTIIFALAGWWDAILRTLSLLDIRINAGGYFLIAATLFVIWLLTFLFFDKQVYMVFTPGLFKVCTEIGGGEQSYSTIGMTVQKQRSDLFRHWILGLGSGDLVVKTTGAQAHHFEMPNVLFVGRKVQAIEDMVRKIPD